MLREHGDERESVCSTCSFLNRPPLGWLLKSKIETRQTPRASSSGDQIHPVSSPKDGPVPLGHISNGPAPLRPATSSVRVAGRHAADWPRVTSPADVTHRASPPLARPGWSYGCLTSRGSRALHQAPDTRTTTLLSGQVSACYQSIMYRHVCKQKRRGAGRRQASHFIARKELALWGGVGWGWYACLGRNAMPKRAAQYLSRK